MQLTERFEMRLDPQTLQQVEAWRDEQPDQPSRAEAVRRLIADGLAISGKEAMRFSPGEKLILSMLCDLYKHQDVRNGVDPEFVIDALCGGHYWAFESEYSGLFAGHVDNPRVVSEVIRMLHMWDLVEAAYERLPEEEKQRVDTESDPFGGSVLFRGFDGNCESEHLAIAYFLVDRANRFQRFKGRDLNSHMPSLGFYRRMRVAFEAMKPYLFTGRLPASRIIELLKAQIPPEHSSGS